MAETRDISPQEPKMINGAAKNLLPNTIVSALMVVGIFLAAVQPMEGQIDQLSKTIELHAHSEAHVWAAKQISAIEKQLVTISVLEERLGRTENRNNRELIRVEEAIRRDLAAIQADYGVLRQRMEEIFEVHLADPALHHTGFAKAREDNAKLLGRIFALEGKVALLEQLSGSSSAAGPGTP
jgi:hypothetical protein